MRLTEEQRGHLVSALNAITSCIYSDNKGNASFNYDEAIDFATYHLMEVHVGCGCVKLDDGRWVQVKESHVRRSHVVGDPGQTT